MNWSKHYGGKSTRNTITMNDTLLTKNTEKRRALLIHGFTFRDTTEICIKKTKRVRKSFQLKKMRPRNGQQRPRRHVMICYQILKHLPLQNFQRKR
eukprot:23501_1